MRHSSVTSSSKRWQTVVIVLVISCELHVSLSALQNRFHRKRNTESRNQEPEATVGRLSRDVCKRSMRCRGEATEHEATTQPSTHKSTEGQIVTPVLCTQRRTAWDITNQPKSRNASLTWLYVKSLPDPTDRNSAVYRFDRLHLMTNDAILNATIFTPISITTSGNLAQPDSPPTPNVTISMTITDVSDINRQVQYTMVHSPAIGTSGAAGFCHLGTLKRLVQEMLQTDSRNLMVDVKTTCQFPSTDPEVMNCSITHPNGPFLAINFRDFRASS